MSGIPDNHNKISLFCVFSTIVNSHSTGSGVSTLKTLSALQLKRVLEILTHVTGRIWKLSKGCRFVRLYLRVYCLKCQTIEVLGKVLFNETLRLSFVQDIKSGPSLIASPQGNVSLKWKPLIDNKARLVVVNLSLAILRWNLHVSWHAKQR